jgi:glycine dehydrogenase subunit 1
MPFIPHTEDDIQEMLSTIGVSQIKDLFAEIPKSLLIESLAGIPSGLNEMQVNRLMDERAANTRTGKCYIGAGSYQHHIPRAVWDITMRGENLTAYTPYQAEASQGTLQLLFEYQTMIASLMGMEVSNASLYDGATSLLEAVLMACRVQKNAKKISIWLPASLNPLYTQVLKTTLSLHDFEMVFIPFDEKGLITIDILNSVKESHGNCTILVIPQPNFFGCIEDVNTLTNWARSMNALVIGVVNPIAMAWLKPPGQWGERGAHIACGEGQPLGIPLASGGPYVGFLCCKMEHVRQMPGRLVGKTQDSDGKIGFTLTLQAREQHIRREKATSNICTNQGLLVTAATIYMSLLGPKGLLQVAQVCHQQTKLLIDELKKIDIKPLFDTIHFHEVAITLPISADEVVLKMQQRGIACGYALGADFPELQNVLLVCVTETKTKEDIIEYVKKLKEIIDLRH